MPTQQQEIEFGDLLNRNSQIINSICLRYCGGNAFYFDELRQECAVAIWSEFSRYGLDRFRGDSAESTWIYQISYHAVIDYLRKSKEVRFLSFDDLSDTDLVTTDTQHDWQLFDELKEHLNHNEQTLLDYYINDEPCSTISHAEGITETAARKRMSRLINKLKMLVHK